MRTADDDLCQQCKARPCTKFVSVPQYGFGGNPAYGSFRAARCEVCAEGLKTHPAFAGMRVDITNLAPREVLV